MSAFVGCIEEEGSEHFTDDATIDLLLIEDGAPTGPLVVELISMLLLPQFEH